MTTYLSYINIPVFIVSFLLGLFAVYMTAPKLRTIEVTPSPENADKIQYRDKTDHYFQFKEVPVTCPSNTKDVVARSLTVPS